MTSGAGCMQWVALEDNWAVAIINNKVSNNGIGSVTIYQIS